MVILAAGILGFVVGALVRATRSTEPLRLVSSNIAPKRNDANLEMQRSTASKVKDAATTAIRQGSAGGLLLQAIRDNAVEPAEWIDVVVGDIIVKMARDAFKAPIAGKSTRLPVSYADTVEVCRRMNCIAPTKDIVDAAYRECNPFEGNDSRRLVFTGLVRSEADYARMGSIDFAERFSRSIDKQLEAKPRAGVICGPWKYWILHPRIVERGAVNYGAFDLAGLPIQTVGGRHDASHFDYSQLLQPVQRAARMRDGRPIDLVDYFISKGLPRSYVEAFA